MFWHTNLGHVQGVKPIPVAMCSKGLVCSRYTAETVGSNPAEGMDVRLLCLCDVLVAASTTG
jgi:hypothetical protein